MLGDFHIHGYNHHAKLMPGKSSNLTFTAKATGTFVVKLHLFDDDRAVETTHTHKEKTNQSMQTSFSGNNNNAIEENHQEETEVKLLTLEVRPR